mmetsp:Transcript_14219/g.29474  ORF Transcript_14219/g.29474 Transcript_14219/m.29474 type:complete len:228 (-) Transcript_14219:2331-3014(-)
METRWGKLTRINPAPQAPNTTNKPHKSRCWTVQQSHSAKRESRQQRTAKMWRTKKQPKKLVKILKSRRNFCLTLRQRNLPALTEIRRKNPHATRQRMKLNRSSPHKMATRKLFLLALNWVWQVFQPAYRMKNLKQIQKEKLKMMQTRIPNNHYNSDNQLHPLYQRSSPVLKRIKLRTKVCHSFQVNSANPQSFGLLHAWLFCSMDIRRRTQERFILESWPWLTLMES